MLYKNIVTKIISKWGGLPLSLILLDAKIVLSTKPFSLFELIDMQACLDRKSTVKVAGNIASDSNSVKKSLGMHRKT